MWLKVIVCLLVVAFGVFVGYLLSHSYRARRDFYRQLCRFNEEYLNELSYYRRPIGDFLRIEEYSGAFSHVLESVVSGNIKVKQLEFLSQEEQNEVFLFFSMIGKGDARSQRDFFGAKKSVLMEKSRESDEIAKKKGDLYLKLGLLAGLAVVILIV